MSTLLIQAVVAVCIFLAGVAGGIKWHAGQDAIAEQARQVNQRATERLRRQNANTAAVVHEAEKVVIREKFVPIIQEVDRVVTQTVYRDSVCLPDDGLRVLRSAISRANGDPGEPGNPVPASPATP